MEALLQNHSKIYIIMNIYVLYIFHILNIILYLYPLMYINILFII